ncbi:MAG: single-stranded DNA-binding protein [Actinomyces sp.]|nr:single-stranded DNA-binding protein [Actinomyces sp.]
MALTAQAVGHIAEPDLKFTNSGKAVLELRINVTLRRKDRQTGDWSDDGAPNWVSATFWQSEAERLAEILHKGDKVTIIGTLVKETYQKRDGGEGGKDILRYPTLLDVVSKADRSNAPQRSQEAAGGAYGGGQAYSAGPGAQTGAQSDPWGGQQTSAPF